MRVTFFATPRTANRLTVDELAVHADNSSRGIVARRESDKGKAALGEETDLVDFSELRKDSFDQSVAEASADTANVACRVAATRRLLQDAFERHRLDFSRTPVSVNIIFGRRDINIA